MERDVLQVFASTYVAESDIDTDAKLQLIDYIKEADEFGVMYLLSTGEMLAEDEYLDEEAQSILAEQYETALEPLLELSKKKKALAKLEKGKRYVKGAAGSTKKAVTSAAGATGRAAGKVGKELRKVGGAMKPSAMKGQYGALKRAAGGIRKPELGGGRYAGKRMMRAAKGLGKGAGGYAALAATATAAGYGAYKKFFSAASKACAGKSGSERSACVGRFRKQAKMAQVKELQKGMGGCGSSGDPAKCREKFAGKIAKAKSKM